MAKKKNWLDVAKDIAIGTAANVVVPGGTAAYLVGKTLYDNITNDDAEDSSYVDLAFDAYDNDEYEVALKYAQLGKDEFKSFHYHRLCGLCHYNMMLRIKDDYVEKAKQLGIDSDTDDDDPRWEKIENIIEDAEKERQQAYQQLRACIQSKVDHDDFENDLLARVYWILMDLCDKGVEGLFEQRRYAIAALAGEEIRNEVKQEYEAITEKLLEYQFDDGYLSLEKIYSGENPEHYPNNPELVSICESQLFSSIDYHERQFIYIAKNIEALAGCYDDNIQWLFTIDKLPVELRFPIGHPQPNSLYYAHPAKKGWYLPFEGIDEELFNDKVQDFKRLVQGLGATEIVFRSMKGHTNFEAASSEYNIEGGVEYNSVGVSGEYGRKRAYSNSTDHQSERQMSQRFNPTKYPYVPDDVAWLSVDPEWQRLVKMRMEGNMLHHSVSISSKKTLAVTDSRLDSVKAAFKAFVDNANMSFSRQMENSFHREEEMEWEITVTFKPLSEFSEPNEEVSTEESRLALLTSTEQEYIDNLKEFFEDDVEITPRERKMLNRIRLSLGISEERAAELEASLKPQLTEDEKEYLDMYKDYSNVGELTDKARHRLNKYAKALGLTESRTKELESLLGTNYHE